MDIYENYLPRLLYPATYERYCGPTPEIQVNQGCVAHGWHNLDQPTDRVDDACRIHDISYCNCQTELLVRRDMSKKKMTKKNNNQQTSTTITIPDDDSIDVSSLKEIPLLSSLTALRHILTKPGIEYVVERLMAGSSSNSNGSDDDSNRSIILDKEYFDCINRADKQLITTGIQLRSEIQRTKCNVKSGTSGSRTIGPTTSFGTIGGVGGAGAGSSFFTTVAQATTATEEESSSVTSSMMNSDYYDNINANEDININDNKDFNNDDSHITWFCDVNSQNSHTLEKFEKISLDLFLRNLDSDETENEYIGGSTMNKKMKTTKTTTTTTTTSPSPSLVELEKRRQLDLQREMQSQEEVITVDTGRGRLIIPTTTRTAASAAAVVAPTTNRNWNDKVTKAANSKLVRDDEELMLQRLKIQ